MALLKCQSDPDLVCHSDQGSQCTDQKYQALLKDHSIRSAQTFHQ
jgi:hypothetical protein